MITKPTPGALVDRLAILRLKIKGARQRNLPHDHFLLEQDEIIGALAPFRAKLPKDPMEALIKLHETLWDVTDRHKEVLEGEKLDQAWAILRALWALNSERYVLIGKIDLACNTYAGREKIF